MLNKEVMSKIAASAASKGRRKINPTVLIAITLQFGRILSGLR